MSQVKKFQKNFKEKVIEIVKNIPKGKVLTYGKVAEMSGARGAGRAVGTIMKNNSDKNIPCHRVVRSDGKIGEYNFLQGKSKKEILEKEGIKFTRSDKIII